MSVTDIRTGTIPGGSWRQTVMRVIPFLVLGLLTGISSTGHGASNPLMLEERAWVEQHDGKIVVNNESGRPPIIDTDKDGKAFAYKPVVKADLAKTVRGCWTRQRTKLQIILDRIWTSTMKMKINNRSEFRLKLVQFLTIIEIPQPLWHRIFRSFIKAFNGYLFFILLVGAILSAKPCLSIEGSNGPAERLGTVTLQLPGTL